MLKYSYAPEEPKSEVIPNTPEEQNSFERKIELERELMELGCETLNISDLEWVNRYMDLFREMYTDPVSNFRGRFEEVYDKNPEEFYIQAHKELFDKYKQKVGGK